MWMELGGKGVIFVIRNQDVPPLPILTKMAGGMSWMSWPGTGWFTHPKEPLGYGQGILQALQTPGSSSHPSTTVLTSWKTLGMLVST